MIVMPFKSKSQLRTCYGKRSKTGGQGWNCDLWLEETPSICDLPERHTQSRKGPSASKGTKRRQRKRNEKIKGPIITGPRGGRYFIITERDKRGIKCQIKVYV